MPRRRKTQFDELKEKAGEAGFLVARHSPGDGRTRYRFFDKRDVRRLYGRGALKKQSYFGPASGTCTVIGLKKAHRFLDEGVCH